MSRWVGSDVVLILAGVTLVTQPTAAFAYATSFGGDGGGHHGNVEQWARGRWLTATLARSVSEYSDAPVDLVSLSTVRKSIPSGRSVEPTPPFAATVDAARPTPLVVYLDPSTPWNHRYEAGEVGTRTSPVARGSPIPFPHPSRTRKWLQSVIKVTNQGLLFSSKTSPINSSPARVSKKMVQSLLPVEQSVFVTFFISCFVLALPIVYLPAASLDVFALADSLVTPTAASTTVASGSVAQFVTHVASVGILGGAAGKMINGFVCQSLGGRHATSLYLLLMGICSATLGCHPSVSVNGVGYLQAAMEFAASIQWIAASTLLANHYRSSPTQFAHGVTMAGLGGTAGSILAKITATAMLQSGSWRTVAQLGGVLAILGGLLARAPLFLMEHPSPTSSVVPMTSRHSDTTLTRAPSSSSSGRRPHRPVLSAMASTPSYGHLLQQPRRFVPVSHSTMSSVITATSMVATTTTGTARTIPTTSPNRLIQSVRNVLGSPLFWWTGMAHSALCLAASSDKILGSFIQYASSLPQSLCGGLTMALTLGFVHGLSNTKKYHAIADFSGKRRMLQRSYATAAVATLGLAACGLPCFRTRAPLSGRLVAAVIALLTGIMASSLSFQYYQLPNMISSLFGRDNAICLSFLDALGFFVSAGIWSTFGWLVSNAQPYGWSIGLTLMAALHILGGSSLLHQLPSIVTVNDQLHR